MFSPSSFQEGPGKNEHDRYELILEHICEIDWLDYSRNENKTSILVDNNWTEF